MALTITHTQVAGTGPDPDAVIDGDDWDASHTIVGTIAASEVTNDPAGTIQNVADTVLTPQMFGATGDGATDDYDAFAAAHAALPDTGGRIVIPPGIYKLGSTWEIGIENVTVEIDIQGGAIINPHGSLTSLIKITETGVRITGKGVISNASSYATNGIECDVPATGVQTIIEDQYIASFTNGILWSGGHSPIIQNNFMNNTNNIVFADEGVSAGIHNNYLIGGNGITASYSTVHMEGPSITGNNILVTTGTHAIRLNGALEVHISGNIIDAQYQTTQAAYGLYLNGDVSGGLSCLHIQGNWIAAGNFAGSAAVYGDGGGSVALTRLDLTNNTIIQAAGTANVDGIVLDSVNELNVYNNFLLNITRNSIALIDVVNGRIVGNHGVSLGSGPNQTGGSATFWLMNDAQPASTKSLRLLNDKPITQRNVANDTDLDVLNLGSSNNLVVGGVGVNAIIPYVDMACGGTVYPLTPGGSSVGTSGNRWGTIYGVAGNFSGGAVTLSASTTSYPAAKLATGSAPSSPADGDVWFESNTNTGLKIRVNGVTKTITLS